MDKDRNNPTGDDGQLAGPVGSWRLLKHPRLAVLALLVMGFGWGAVRWCNHKQGIGAHAISSFDMSHGMGLKEVAASYGLMPFGLVGVGAGLTLLLAGSGWHFRSTRVSAEGSDD